MKKTRGNLINYHCCIFCYSGGTFLFSFHVSPIYPHEAPKVKCKTKVGWSFHYIFNYRSRFWVFAALLSYSVTMLWIYLSLHIVFAGLPSKYWFGRECLSQHLKRRLETCPEYKHCYLWLVSSLYGMALFFEVSWLIFEIYKI